MFAFAVNAPPPGKPLKLRKNTRKKATAPGAGQMERFALSRGREFAFLEFFAGGGMAGLGLGPDWRCAFANDFDPMKRAAYGANFGLAHHSPADIHDLELKNLPQGDIDLAWASSPCQDLSLAGARGGLAARRSGAFFGFWRLVEALDAAGRAPRAVVVENVVGLLTSNSGRDFSTVAAMMAARGYIVTALVLNASDFVPQSRPRLFVVGLYRNDAPMFAKTAPEATPSVLKDAVARLSPAARKNWRWISVAPQPVRNLSLIDIIATDAPFDSAAATRARLRQMAPRQRSTIEALRKSGERHVGAAYRRVRIEGGVKRSRIEARFDGIAGCIRTAAGGSSRQIIFDISAGKIRSRLMTPREAARAMGLSEDYVLPERATAAFKLIGDGVAPPVVSWLAENVLEPALFPARKAA